MTMTDKTHSSINPSRRRFVISASGAVGVAALASVLPRAAQAADLPAINPKDSAPAALAYTEDSASSTNAKHVAGSECLNCDFYQARGTTNPRGPCMIFPGKSVNAKGWCMSYVKVK
ncbi:MAG: high-potential iron-sulfur protein [Desulfovibrionaceae bacterium]|jgi:hypothetical protein|nr:high-potential iron-sulfur protein [Desulfovibrionaceae bacterium]